MALVAHRMMLPARHRRSTQQVARNKVGVLLVPSVADYYAGDVVPPPAAPLPTPAVSQQQLNLQPDPPETAVEGSGGGSGKFLAGNQATCLGLSGILEAAMLTAQSCTDLVTAAHVEVGNGSQVHLAHIDSVLANTPGGQVNAIIKQAAREYEMVKRQQFLGKGRRDATIGAQAVLKCSHINLQNPETTE